MINLIHLIESFQYKRHRHRNVKKSYLSESVDDINLIHSRFKNTCSIHGPVSFSDWKKKFLFFSYSCHEFHRCAINFDRNSARSMLYFIKIIVIYVSIIICLCEGELVPISYNATSLERTFYLVKSKSHTNIAEVIVNEHYDFLSIH